MHSLDPRTNWQEERKARESETLRLGFVQVRLVECH
jgi:hypothetical protein